jgi:hypothetical protein
LVLSECVVCNSKKKHQGLAFTPQTMASLSPKKQLAVFLIDLTINGADVDASGIPTQALTRLLDIIAAFENPAEAGEQATAALQSLVPMPESGEPSREIHIKPEYSSILTRMVDLGSTVILPAIIYYYGWCPEDPAAFLRAICLLSRDDKHSMLSSLSVWWSILLSCRLGPSVQDYLGAEFATEFPQHALAAQLAMGANGTATLALEGLLSRFQCKPNLPAGTDATSGQDWELWPRPYGAV